MMEDTEWNDILRQKGIIPPKQDDISRIINEVMEERDGLESKTMDELDLLLEEDDDRVTSQYRDQRMKELMQQANSEIFGSIQEISKSQYEQQVTVASKKHWFSFLNRVIVILYQNYIQNSNKLMRDMAEFAVKYKSVKFVKIQANACIENYPDKNGEMVKQWIGMVIPMETKKLEMMLKKIGAFGKVSLDYRAKSDDDNDDGDIEEWE